LFFQAILSAFVFSFAILGARDRSTFLPRRDYSFFIASLDLLSGPESTGSPAIEPTQATKRLHSGS
jgi:hypothetical protein